MAETNIEIADLTEIPEYDSEEEQAPEAASEKKPQDAKRPDDTYVAIHSSGFRNFYLNQNY